MIPISRTDCLGLNLLSCSLKSIRASSLSLTESASSGWMPTYLLLYIYLIIAIEAWEAGSFVLLYLTMAFVMLLISGSSVTL